MVVRPRSRSRRRVFLGVSQLFMLGPSPTAHMTEAVGTGNILSISSDTAPPPHPPRGFTLQAPLAGPSSFCLVRLGVAFGVALGVVWPGCWYAIRVPHQFASRSEFTSSDCPAAIHACIRGALVSLLTEEGHSSPRIGLACLAKHFRLWKGVPGFNYFKREDAVTGAASSRSPPTPRRR